MVHLNNTIRSLLSGLAVLLLAGQLAASGVQDLWPASAQGFSGTGEVKVLEANDHGILLEVSTGDFELQHLSVDGREFVRLVTESESRLARPGQPDLPMWSALIGVPPIGQFDIQVETSDTETIRLDAPLIPAPRVILQTPVDPASLADPTMPVSLSTEKTYTPDAGVYETDADYPGDLARIESDGYVREQRVAQLSAFPFQYNPVRSELRIHHKIRVKVVFVQTAEALPWPKSTDRDSFSSPAFESLLRSALINYESARQWRVSPKVAPVASKEVETVGPTSGAMYPAGDPAYKITVNQDGLYKITYAELQAAGLPVTTLDPRTFQLWNLGNQVAIYVEDETDGSFDPEDYLLFYGLRARTKYTNTNVYWLTFGGEEGLRMGQRDVTPQTAPEPDYYMATLHLEEDHFYVSSITDASSTDRWFWTTWLNTSAPTRLFTGTLEYPYLTAPVSATLRTSVVGFSDVAGVNPDHHLRFSVNSHVVGDLSWDGRVTITATLPVSLSVLTAGANQIRTDVMADTGASSDVGLIDWFELRYPAQFKTSHNKLQFSYDVPGTWKYRIEGFTNSAFYALDVSDPAMPVLLVNGSVDGALGNFSYVFEDHVASAREYLVQTADACLSVAGIIQYQGEDLKATTNGADYLIISHPNFMMGLQSLAAHRSGQGLRVKVVSIEDVYNQFAYGLFTPQAIRDFIAYAYANWQPPAPAYVLLVGDGHYDFKNNLNSGMGNYIPPYLADVDPWLIETASDNRLVTVVGDDPLPDLYIGRFPVNNADELAVMVNKVIDYETNPSPGDWNQRMLFVADNADAAGNFAALSDDVVDEHVPDGYTSDRIYYMITHTTVSAVKEAIRNGINEGALIVNYVGHASIYTWGHEGLWHINQISTLTNGGKLPVMLPMTCYDGYFHSPYPQYPSMGESMVRAAGRGAIASFSATGLGVAAGHDYLNRGFFDAVFQSDIHQIGLATLAAKLNLYTNTNSYRDLIDTYLLLGDPALTLNLPKAQLRLQPGWNLVSPAVIPHAGQFTASTMAASINSQDGGVTEIHRWLNGGWDSFLVGLPFNDFGIQPQMGYFVKTDQASDWTVYGPKYTQPVTITLNPGWNLVAVPYSSTSPLTAEDMCTAINTQGGNAVEIHRWQDAAWDSHACNEGFNNFTIEPNQGYFVKTTVGSTYVP